ncbi:MAG: hypothetical protein ABJA74_17520 [Lapillicoccus sp.]
MPTITATVRTLPDTQAAVVRAGTHTLVADRAEGVAGGSGLGFNGAQLLASAIGVVWPTTCASPPRTRGSTSTRWPSTSRSSSRGQRPRRAANRRG